MRPANWNSCPNGFRPLALGRGGAALRHGEQAVYRRAAVRIVLGPQAPAVRRDNRAGNRETQAEPLRLGGDERLEQPIG